MPAPHAPLAPHYRAIPYWWDDGPSGGEAPAGPCEGIETGGALVLPTEVDVAIIGGGYTGLGAALELGRRGRQAVVLDRQAIASGASGRNGGMVHPGGKHTLHHLLTRPQGRALWDVTVEAFEQVEALTAELGIRCDWRRSGHLELAHHPRAVGALRAEDAARRSIGEETTFVGRDALRDEIGTDAYHGGLLVARSGSLHPGRFAAGLAVGARRAGAILAPCTPVVALDRHARGGFAVRTARGTIRARDVLVATNGYTGAITPWLARRILPVGSFIIATESIDADLARSISPRARMFFDTKNFLSYWRLSPDGTRVLFGGRTSFAPTTVEVARDRLYQAMVRIHPQLAGVAVEHAWGGNVALTVDRTPHLGRHPGTGLVHAMGYCGTGVAMATHLGRATGRWLAGDGELPAHALLPWKRVPLPGRAPALLPVAGWWYQALDRLGA